MKYIMMCHGNTHKLHTNGRNECTKKQNPRHQEFMNGRFYFEAWPNDGNAHVCFPQENGQPYVAFNTAVLDLCNRVVSENTLTIWSQFPTEYVTDPSTATLAAKGQ